MHQNVFGGQAPPRPAGGAYSAVPNPLAELRNKGEERSGKREGRRMKGRCEEMCLKCVVANGPL